MPFNLANDSKAAFAYVADDGILVELGGVKESRSDVQGGHGG